MLGDFQTLWRSAKKPRWRMTKDSFRHFLGSFASVSVYRAVGKDFKVFWVDGVTLCDKIKSPSFAAAAILGAWLSLPQLYRLAEYIDCV